MTPGVRQFVRVVIPATLGAGVYQISAFIDTFFLARIGTGALSYFNYADRLNQLPLGVIGAALGTAILPAGQPHVGAERAGQGGDASRARRPSWRCCCACPPRSRWRSARCPLVSALFQGGRFTRRGCAH